MQEIARQNGKKGKALHGGASGECQAAGEKDGDHD